LAVIEGAWGALPSKILKAPLKLLNIFQSPTSYFAKKDLSPLKCNEISIYGVEGLVYMMRIKKLLTCLSISNLVIVIV